MTMHYCDITNLSGTMTGPENIPSPPTAVQITGNWPITLSPGLLLWSSLSPGRNWCRDPSHLVWVAQVCPPQRVCGPLLSKDVLQRKLSITRPPSVTNLLPVILGSRSGIRFLPLRAFKTAFSVVPTSKNSALLFHVFVGAVSQCRLFIYQ